MSQDNLSRRELVIGPNRHEVRIGEQRLELTKTEFLVLQFLANSPGQILSRVQILDGIHGERYAITPRAIDGHIVGLRRKLGELGPRIETIRKAGYRFQVGPETTTPNAESQQPASSEPSSLASSPDTPDEQSK